MRHTHSQQVLEPVLVDTDDVVNGTRLGGTLVITHLIVNGIHPHDGINIIQGAVAPQLNLIPYLLRNIADGLLGDTLP